LAKKSQTASNGPNLVIVESPAKAKTINRYLGKGYTVKASMGHVRDLPTGDIGVDINNGFEPKYTIPTGRKKIIAELKKISSTAGTVYLATDLDREGEAIAWHLAEALDLPPERMARVVFNEITKTAIQNAFANPHQLDMAKVNAQQARRILDRIVGYQLSPLLWQKVAKGLSAGRVQSVATRLVVEREQEIRDFVPTESWRISGYFSADPQAAAKLSEALEEFLEGGADPDTGRTQKERAAWLAERRCLSAELIEVGGQPFKPTDAEQCLAAAEALGFRCEEVDRRPWKEYAKHNLDIVDLNGVTDAKAAPEFVVSDIQTKRTSSKPPAPFITASLQQAASSSLGFTTSRTMRVAQALYEGVDVGTGDGPVGLITYMRTDSRVLSKEAVAQVRDMIGKKFGQEYLPEKPNTYGSAKRAQEAHEAIRPSNVDLSPEAIKSKLTSEQFKLYQLIWRRFVACQMTPAKWDSTTLLISADTAQGRATLKATGRRLVFDGFQRVTGVTSSEEATLPEVEVDHQLGCLCIDPQQKYTSPPARYSEASLVKALEAEGIGRPSTYASIIQTIQDRGYVEQIDRRIYATAKGEVVTKLLIEHFPRLMDLKFTSHMENELDKIEEEHLDWISVLDEFYGPFKELLDKAQTDMQPVRAEPSEYECPKCGKPMVYRWARTGRFLSCSGYPECDGAFNIDRAGKPIVPKDIDVKCDICGEKMVMRQSRHGPFLGCSGYPECSNTIACDPGGEPLKLVKDMDLEKPCEMCGDGTMNVRRRGMRAFLACDKYPKCKNTSPIPEGVRLERKVAPVEHAGFACEKCGQPMHIKSGRRGKFIACSGFPRCRTTQPIEKLDELLAQAEEKGTTIDPEKIDSAANGKSKRRAAATNVPKTPEGKVDFEALGKPPPGYAWTRTGKPVVETWPEDSLACPQCGSEMVLRRGRFGPFYSCSNFPKCRCSVNLRGEAKKQAEIEMPAPARPKPIPTEIACSECGENMLIRHGRTGPFLGCSAYPKCKSTQPIPEGMDVPEPVVQG
jgi:DNA topoisomerase-1